MSEVVHLKTLQGDIVKNGEIISKSYTQTNPYMLYVEVDYEDGETVIFPLLLIWM